MVESKRCGGVCRKLARSLKFLLCRRVGLLMSKKEVNIIVGFPKSFSRRWRAKLYIHPLHPYPHMRDLASPATSRCRWVIFSE